MIPFCCTISWPVPVITVLLLGFSCLACLRAWFCYTGTGVWCVSQHCEIGSNNVCRDAVFYLQKLCHILHMSTPMKWLCTVCPRSWACSHSSLRLLQVCWSHSGSHKWEGTSDEPTASSNPELGEYNGSVGFHPWVLHVSFSCFLLGSLLYYTLDI